MENGSNRITKKPSIHYSNTDLTDLESQRCDVIDEFSMFERQMTQMEDVIIPALAMRCYHLPGNTYGQDILQYFRNNHPILSMFFHHVQHPIKFRMRALQLFGSVIFGLAVTNIIWLWLYFSNTDEDEPVVTIQIGEPSATDFTNTSTQQHFEITRGMLLLWTVGGALHAIYDNTIWYISACVCCLSSTHLDSYRKWGTNFIVTVVLTFTAIATLALLLRTSAEEEAQNVDDDVVQIKFYETYVYKFLISYATELVLALFIYYPVIALTLFSGVLGCGKVPILGGRPYEVALAEKAYKESRLQQRRSTMTKKPPRS
jgi:hypothetical protein